MAGTIRDIGHAFERIEKGLDRHINNDEVIKVVEDLRSAIVINDIKIMLLHYGDCPYREGDRYERLSADVIAHDIRQLPEDIEDRCAEVDMIVYALFDNPEQLDPETKSRIKELSRTQPNACLAMTDAHKRACNSLVVVRRQRAVVVEDRRRDLASIMKKINEETPLSTFVLAKRGSNIHDQIDLLDFAVKETSQNAAAKSIINTGEFLEMQIADLRKLSKQLSVLKSKLQRSFKQINHEIEQQNNEFFGHASEVNKSVRGKIEAFKGFREEELGKNVIVRITDGFVTEVYDEIEESASQHLRQQIDLSLDRIKALRRELDQALRSIEIDVRINPEESLDEKAIQRVFEATPRGNKELERSFGKKGMYALFMELRTPMFMLMPLIMLVMLFKPVLGVFQKIGQEDVIDRAVTAIDGSPTIKVVAHPRAEKIPEIYDLLYTEIEADINGRDLGDSPFTVKGDLRIRVNTVQEGNKSRNEPVIKQDADAVYVMLESDRDEIVRRFEEEYLSVAKKRGSSGTGMGAIFKMIGNIPHSEYVLLGLLGLIVYYVRVKMREFDKEVEVDSGDAKKTIKNNFTGDVDRYISTLSSKWKSLQDHWLRSTQERFVAELENSINRKIDGETKKVQELKVLYDKRSKRFKETEKELRDYQNELKKLKQDVASIARL